MAPNIATSLANVSRTPLMPMLAGILSAAGWGFGIVASRAALEARLDIFALALVQLAASVVLLGGISTMVGRPPRRALVSRSMPSGTIEYAFTYTVFALGVARTTAGNAAIIAAAEPVLIALLAALLLRERIGRRFLVALAVIVASLLLVTGPDLTSVGRPRDGDLLVLASTAAGAFYAVLNRRLVADADPLPLALAQQAVGLVVLGGAVAVLVAAGVAPPPRVVVAPREALWLAILSGLLQHSAAVWLHLHALRGMTAGRFGIVLSLVPVFALIGAYAMLGESITVIQLAGAALIGIAIILSRRSHESEKT
ncbi:DMT family transporter [Rhizobium terrae]|uniref:DMT family transporter n=1 Tax=Rhizobium terrae TaxID=2171756 RepID=UPI000E3E279D|nr:DMT family transporter [Rhizobium terrae]